MKKIAIFLLALLFAWAVAQPAQAGHGRAGAFILGLGLGALLLPPLLHPAPPPVVIHEPHDPPPPPPEYGRYGDPPPDRVWVPGHWEQRWNGYARVWERFWIPGHWSY